MALDNKHKRASFVQVPICGADAAALAPRYLFDPRKPARAVRQRDQERQPSYRIGLAKSPNVAMPAPKHPGFQNITSFS